MKLTKGQLKEILKEEIREALKIGGHRYVIDPPSPEDAAFKKLREIMGLVEKAMLYMTGDDEAGTNPVEVVEMALQILADEEDLNETFGGYTGALGGGGFSYNLGAIAGRRPSTKEDPDSIIQSSALEVFMELGLEQKVAKILAQNVASPDLVMVMDLIRKVDTAQEGEPELQEILSSAADAGEYIKDFKKSDAPQFKGKSEKKKKEMAIAAHAAAKEKRGKKR